MVRVPVPDTEPKWVRDFHKQGLTEFAEESKVLILRAAYYLGESFTRASGALSWTIGNAELIEKNIPVISGFRSGTEMAPMMVCENVFGRILSGGVPESDVDRMVEAWARQVPP